MFLIAGKRKPKQVRDCQCRNRSRNHKRLQRHELKAEEKLQALHLRQQDRKQKKLRCPEAVAEWN